MSDTWEVRRVISQFDLLWFCLNPPNCFEIPQCLVVIHFISVCLHDVLETSLTNGCSLRSFSESNRSCSEYQHFCHVFAVWMLVTYGYFHMIWLRRSCTELRLTSIRITTHSSVFLTAFCRQKQKVMRSHSYEIRLLALMQTVSHQYLS